MDAKPALTQTRNAMARIRVSANEVDLLLRRIEVITDPGNEPTFMHIGISWDGDGPSEEALLLQGDDEEDAHDYELVRKLLLQVLNARLQFHRKRLADAADELARVMPIGGFLP